MDIKELRKLNNQEIVKLLEESSQRLRELRFDLSFGKIKNVSEIQKLKNQIAKIMTILKGGDKVNKK